MYEKLYAENSALLWYWANRYANACRMRPELDIDDLFQTGFFALIEASESYEPAKGSWGSWASLYIRKTMREAVGLRGRRHICALSLDAPVMDADGNETSKCDLLPDESLIPADESMIDAETKAAVHAAIDAIKSEKARLAVRFVYIQGDSYARAAQRIGVEAKQVSALLSSGRRSMYNNVRLRRALSLDEETRFDAHKGWRAFQSDRTSVVEAAVMWREKQRERKK